MTGPAPSKHDRGLICWRPRVLLPPRLLAVLSILVLRLLIRMTADVPSLGRRFAVLAHDRATNKPLSHVLLAVMDHMLRLIIGRKMLFEALLLLMVWIKVLSSATIVREVERVFDAGRPLALGVPHREVRVCVGHLGLGSCVVRSWEILMILRLCGRRPSSKGSSLLVAAVC